MKKIAIFAAMALAAGCATNEEVATVDTTAEPIVEKVGPAVGSQEALEAAAGHRVFFGYDQHTLSSQAQATLQRQAQWLSDNPAVAVQLAGNADERGTREYNLALGSRRAEAAKAYLVSLGVDSGRLRTVSYGKERPIAQGANEQAWSQNRNSTTTVVSSGG
jgi:peptidoglycan-associated lipoprotein